MFCVHLCKCTMCMQSPWILEEGYGFSGMALRMLLAIMWVVGTELDFLQEKPLLLPTEPFLQLQPPPPPCPSLTSELIITLVVTQSPNLLPVSF